MGDVVLAALLKARGLRVAPITQPDFWVASEAEDALDDVMNVATVLRRLGASVEYALRPQPLGKQRKAAFSAGTSYFALLAADFRQSRRLDVQPLVSKDGARQPSLHDLLANSPATVDSLAEVIGRNRHVLRSVD
jgi:histidyl-tRNA synthetase